MRSEKVPTSEWLKNFTNTVTGLINENKKNGYQVTAIVLTIGLYDKLVDALNYEPTDWLGYVIKILEQTEEQFKEEGEIVFISGNAIN